MSPVLAATSEPLSVAEAKRHPRIGHNADDHDVAAYIEVARDHVERVTRRVLVTSTWDMTLDRFPYDEITPPVPWQSVSSVAYLDDAGDSETWDAAEYVVETAREPGRLVPGYDYAWPVARLQAGSVTVRFVAGILTPFTAVAATDILTASGRTFANGTTLRLRNSGGALPTGLAPLTNYYVVGASGSSFQLSLTSGGAAVTFTDAGSGLNFVTTNEGPFPSILHAMKMLVAHWYESREPIITGTIVAEVPFAVESLLLASRWGSYS